MCHIYRTENTIKLIIVSVRKRLKCNIHVISQVGLGGRASGKSILKHVALTRRGEMLNRNSEIAANQ